MHLKIWFLAVTLTSAFFTWDISASQECLSGRFDTITRTADGHTYAFRGNHVIQLSDNENGIVPGYPKPICAVFPGLPSGLHASVYWPNGKTCFFKGDQYWRTTGTSLDRDYPKSISSGFRGIPPEIDAALVLGTSGNTYFFKGEFYWRYDIEDDVIETPAPVPIRDGWSGLGYPVRAAFKSSDGNNYFFGETEYWKYDEVEDRVEDGFPRTIQADWLGCQDGDTRVDWTDVCIHDLCSTTAASRCLLSEFDAITHIETGVSLGNIFAFRGDMVTMLTPSTGDIVNGYPKPICSVFPGLPSNIDAALSWKNIRATFFFKGALCYRYTFFRLDQGYPKDISQVFPGVPSQIDAAVVTGEKGNQHTYFFKGKRYYRYDRRTGRVPVGYPHFIQTDWLGLPNDIDAAFQWVNGWTYFFKGEQFYRWDFHRSMVAGNYPRPTGSVWFDCRPRDEKNVCWVPQCIFMNYYVK